MYACMCLCCRLFVQAEQTRNDSEHPFPIASQPMHPYDIGRMSVMKYHAILDDGRRCQSCCNRTQLFGARDPMSGWRGDCSVCNIRWYLGQIRCVSRTAMGPGENLLQTGAGPSRLIFLFARLDPKNQRRGVSYERKLKMLKSTLTKTLDSDDEFFDGDEAALQISPLTCLDDTTVQSKRLQREIEAHLGGQPVFPSGRMSLLDVIAVYLVELSTSDSHILRVCSQDYCFEPCWTKYVWEGREWLSNSRTGEFFHVDDPGNWIAYRYLKALWWTKGQRWFWERTDPAPVMDERNLKKALARRHGA